MNATRATVRAEQAPGQVAGTFEGQPKGVILHGSRSGKQQDPLIEYAGTVSWAVGNPGGLGWNVTVGPGVYCVHMTARQWGWNAREHSRDYLAVEFAQPRLSDPITDAMVAAFVEWFRAEVAPVWPGLTPDALLLPMHSELPAGKRDGKTDAFRADSAAANDLRRRVYAALEEAMPETNPYWEEVGPGVAAAMKADGDEPLGPELYTSHLLADGSVAGEGTMSRTPGRKGLYLAAVDGAGAWRVTFSAWR